MKAKMWLSKLFLILTVSIVFSGCAATKMSVVKPVPKIDTSSHTTPAHGMAGIYYYQWKTGVLGAGRDVTLTLNGKVLGRINTGEWLYFDVAPGKYEYRVMTGPLSIDGEVNLEADRVYFFRGMLRNAMAQNHLIMDENEIMDAFENIKSGKYEKGDVD